MPAEPDGLITTDIDIAVERLRAGGLVALPTETVYGLAADAEQPDAVARIFDVKGRPRGHPLIVHVASLEATEGWIGPVSAATSDAVQRLGDICWPGPLTLLVNAGRRVDPIVTGGRTTVGLRVPAHAAALAVLERLGGGVAAPSANRFGRVSPTTAKHVSDDLGDLLDPRRDVVLDGGPCQIGVESTIVDLTVSPPQVLRAGAIDVIQIEQILAFQLESGSGPSRASGMLAAHYSPACQVVVAEHAAEADQMRNRLSADGLAVGLLDRTDDPIAAAHLLYADLRAADLDKLDALVVVLPAAHGDRACDTGPTVQSRRREPPRSAQSRRLSSAIQASRTWSRSGAAAPGTPATSRATLLAPASGASSSRHHPASGWARATSRR